MLKFNVQGASSDLPTVGSLSSAGVFDSTGKLVRTLWSAKQNYPAAVNPVAAWDGTLDDLSVAPTGTYTVKRISSNVAYTWEGAVGNNSPNHINNVSYHNHYNGITDMAITAAGDMFFCHGYDERWRTTHKSTVVDPYHQEYTMNMAFRTTDAPTYTCCSDGTMVYWGTQFISGGTFNYFNANTTADIHNFVTFSGGTPNVINDVNGAINGCAVQKIGNFLFASRFGLSTIDTTNKTTGGTAVQSLSIASPGRLAVNPTSSTELWAVIGATVRKFNVSGTGVLTASGVIISTLSNPQGLAVSPDGSMLLVVDGGTSQQVKAFNTSDGSVKAAWGTSGALGVLGGYANGPAVTNTKFMFTAAVSVPNGGFGYIQFAPDSSIWFGDVGNYRNMHFTSGNSPTFIERTCWMSGFYSTRVCYNDDTRVFGNWLEWHIDYSIPFGIDNGSWTLVNNWLYGITSTDIYDSLQFVGTYSNGRTYASVLDAGVRKIWELTTSGWRDTGKVVSCRIIDHNFNLWDWNEVSPPSTCDFKVNLFTGFDGSNNPTWQDPSASAPTDIFVSVPLPTSFPRTSDQRGVTTRGPGMTLSNGVFPVYNAHSQFFSPEGNHLGGIEASSGQVKFSTNPATRPNYCGLPQLGSALVNYAEVPYFAIRGTNLGDFGGGHLQYKPGMSDAFVCYRGEDWGNNQTNCWIHWHESGLAVGEFGVAAPYYAVAGLQFLNLHLDDPMWGPKSGIDGDGSYNFIYEPMAEHSFKGTYGLAGNSAWGGIAYQNGKYYIYQNDEWYHGGITRWRVDNVNTIQFETAGTVNWNSGSYVAPGTSDPIDLLYGLPVDSVDVPNGTAGWQRSTATNLTNSGGGPWHTVCTNFFKLDPHTNFGPMIDKSPDLTFSAVYGGQLITLYKDFATAASGDWTLDATLLFNNRSNDWTGTNFLYVDILDPTGKVLTRIQYGIRADNYVAVYGNQTPFAAEVVSSPSRFWEAYSGSPRSWIVSSNIGANTMSVTYGDYTLTLSPFEVGASLSTPKRFRVTYDGLGGAPAGSTNLTVVISKLRFLA